MTTEHELPPSFCIPLPPCDKCGQDACDHERECPDDPDGFPRVAVEARPDGHGGYVGSAAL